MNESDFVGIGLRHQHLLEFSKTKPDIGFVEVHTENYLSLGGIDYKLLLEISERYPLSLHGIGMSLGSSEEVSKDLLDSVKILIEETNPLFISDHLSWSSHASVYLPELVPFPFNQETLDIFCKKIDCVQNYLGREMMVENPSSYFEYNISTYSEPEFMNLLCKKTGAKILLDVNNIYVSGINNRFSHKEYIDSIEAGYVKEVHLAGYSVRDFENNKTQLLIDSHDNNVSKEVWDLYGYLVSKTGLVHSLLEWDMNLPPLSHLVQEAKKTLSYNKVTLA